MRLTMLLVATIVAATPARAQTPPCCSITAIQSRTGVVAGRVNANGSTFEFKVTNAALLTSLKVGRAIYVNFTTRQVSIDGRSACCTVSSGPTPAAAVASGRIGVAAAPPTPPAAPVTVSNPSLLPSRVATTISLAPPPIAYGTPHAPAPLADNAFQAQLARYDTRSVTALVGGRNVSGTILHVRGLDGIERAPGLPEGARRLLKMHVRKLAPGESDNYIINLDLANQWFATHSVPDDIQPIDENSSTHSGCNAWSWHCAGEVAAHAADQATQLIQQAQDAWDHAQDELAGVWNTVASCFADQPLSLPNVPVAFNVAPGMSIDLSQTVSGKSTGANTSTKVQGSLGLSFPLQGDFTARVDLFYIPCLPFVVRPKQVGADGTITVGEELKASASASGSFSKTFTIPPSGTGKLPIEVIPIIIAGVPVAELDVSAYIEGNVQVEGQGQVDGQFDMQNPHRAAFDFACNGHGCAGEFQGDARPHARRPRAPRSREGCRSGPTSSPRCNWTSISTRSRLAPARSPISSVRPLDAAA